MTDYFFYCGSNLDIVKNIKKSGEAPEYYLLVALSPQQCLFQALFQVHFSVSETCQEAWPYPCKIHELEVSLCGPPDLGTCGYPGMPCAHAPDDSSNEIITQDPFSSLQIKS